MTREKNMKMVRKVRREIVGTRELQNMLMAKRLSTTLVYSAF